MARKTNVVVIQGDENNRDRGKHFLITEMPCSQAERWANRVIFIMGSSLRAPEGAAGMAALAGMELSAFAGLSTKWPEVNVLMDEMFDCVQFLSDPTNPAIPPRKPREEEIEEVSTRWTLRLEVLSLHMGFSSSDVRSKLMAMWTTSISPPAPTFPHS